MYLTQQQPQHPEQCVFRSVAFPVSVFDYLKDWQRAYEQQHGARLTNNQALAIILREHQQSNVESGERNEQARCKTAP